jgi:hypothetical protein
MNKPPSPSARVRVTVPVTHETLEAFQHLAESSGVSVGRAMGDWLSDQLSAVTWAALRYEEVRDELREAPRSIAHAVAVGASDADGGRIERPARAADRPPAASPPRPVIRGGNSPKGARK